MNNFVSALMGLISTLIFDYYLKAPSYIYYLAGLVTYFGFLNILINAE